MTNKRPASMKLVIELPGEPQAKERPRLGRHGNVYTPKNTARYEKALAWQAKVDMLRVGWPSKMIGPIRITATASFRISKKNMHLLGKTWPARLDVDNFGKAVLDALNGVVYDDDCQVVE